MTPPQPQGEMLTEQELLDRARISTVQLHEWEQAGLLASVGGRYEAGAVARARLLRFATQRGLRAETIVEAVRSQGDLLDRFIDFVGVPPGEPRALEEAASATGLDQHFARRLRAAGGLGSDELFDDDLEAMRTARVALDVGIPEEALLQMVRVMADALARVADANSRLFHFYVHERLRAEGADQGVIDATAKAASDALVELIEPAILFFHRKAWEVALREDMLVHFAEEVAPSGGAVGELPVAVLFVDLVGFTPLTEAMGDAAAAEVVDRFSELVRDEAIDCDGRVVKQIGDEFMLVFPTAEAAVRYGLHLAERAADETHFPALRMGAHIGTAIYREADYLGATVNLAARVTAQAERSQLVVTEAVISATRAMDTAWKALGPRRLKGVQEPVELFATPLPSGPADREIDPVCGMALPPGGATIRASWSGGQIGVCSEACRERFERDPGFYVGAES